MILFPASSTINTSPGLPPGPSNSVSEPPVAEPIACQPDAGFSQWLTQAAGSLVVTTYQAGKLLLLSSDGTQVHLLMRAFDKPMGLAVRGRSLALTTRHAVTFFNDAPLLAPDFFPDRRTAYDALFLPRATYHTGDLNTHDIAFGEDGLWLVASRFCCLASLSKEVSFVPRWRPSFVTETVPEDRCHLNGLAIVNGKPTYVTALGETDSPGGWRANKASGGLIMDVASNQIVVRGLSMPHSPRWHNNRLFFLNSGTGELCLADLSAGRHQVVAALPGYLRGLALVGPYAVVGLCQIRERHIFGGLPVQQKHARLLCGLAVIDLRTGGTVGFFEFTAGCQEIYEIAFLPGVRRGMLLSGQQDASTQAFTAPEFSYWLRPENLVKDFSLEPTSPR